ncbi:hypothetical protein HUU39_12050 [candidate division KSB1 bacterium]|nr:hypothetical protein [bacterium]NUM65991.1 hypothetical protein [candidate division KSB1 bacterium]
MTFEERHAGGTVLPWSLKRKLVARKAKICSVAAFSTRIDAGFAAILEISDLFHFGRKKSRRDAKPQRSPNRFLPAIMKDKTRIHSLRGFAVAFAFFGSGSFGWGLYRVTARALAAPGRYRSKISKNF